MSTVTLVTGGSRSGKSRRALEMVARRKAWAFIATAVAIDEEMAERIARHRAERGPDVFTIEAPLDLAGAVRAIPQGTEAAIVDCLTVWLGNLMHEGRLGSSGWCAEIDEFLDALTRPPCDLIIVTNEVGMGIVPENAMARAFRDAAGTLNQRVSAAADRVVFMVSGIALTVKGDPGQGEAE